MCDIFDLSSALACRVEFINLPLADSHSFPVQLFGRVWANHLNVNPQNVKYILYSRNKKSDTGCVLATCNNYVQYFGNLSFYTELL